MQLLAEGLQFPEGPIAMPDGSVIVVEIARGTLSRVMPDGRVEVIATPGGGPNGAAIGPDGAIYVCNNGGFAWHRDALGVRPAGIAADYSGGRIERVDLATGRVERLYDRCGEHVLNGPNDLVFDSAGGFWFTDAGKSRATAQDHGAVYWARADGSEIRRIAFPMISPNGIGLSPDRSTLYVTETATGRLWEFAITGPSSIERLPYPSPNGGALVAGLGGYTRFDSLAVTESGRVCIAVLGNGGIADIEPKTGTMRHVPFADSFVTNICFGGADMRTTFVTLSHTGRLISTPWREPGLRLHYQTL